MAHIATSAQITYAGWRDLRDLAAIQRASFRRDLAYKWWMLAFFWLMPGITFLVTRDGDRATGSIIADIDRGRIRIMNIAVHPDYRQRGIGTELMNGVLNENPHLSAVLMVQEHNTTAQTMYTRMGFVRTGVLNSYYGPGNTGIEMTLKRD